MKHSSRYFCNVDCEYFPCHEGTDTHNCLFCFCPLYHLDNNCGGDFEITKRGIKDCGSCTFPHIPQNYDAIVEKLK